MTAYPPPPFRHVDPRELKPGRFWYVIAVVVIVVGIGGGLTIFGLGLSSTLRDLPTMEKTFGAGTATTVDLSAKKEWSIYVSHSGEGLPSGLECSATSASGDPATISSPSGSFNFSDGNDNWQLAFNVKVSEPGEYEVTCTSDEATGDFAVGDAADVGGFVGGIFGSLGALFGIPCFAIVVGGAVILVVALRRNADKKRLQRSAG